MHTFKKMQLKLGFYQRSTNAHWKIKRQCSTSAQDISIWWVGVRGRSMTTWKRKGRWSKNALLCPRLCPIHVVCFSLISNLLPNLISDLISDFGIASMLNHTINLDFGNKIYGMINMEAIPKFDIKSVIKFDISIKPTTWIGHKILYFYTEPFFSI